MYEIFFTKQAAKNIPNLKTARLAVKTKTLIDILRKNPYQSPPPYEELKGDLQGVCSRRINHKHRLVYQVNKKNKTVKILSLWTHFY